MKILVWDGDDDIEVTLPSKRIACPTCRGKGTRVNPAIDAHGLSREDFDADPDFAEAYFSGRYDVTCDECQGANVVEVPDEARCTPAQLQAWADYCESKRPCPIQEAERRMGA